jgi:hypothetical protein
VFLEETHLAGIPKRLVETIGERFHIQGLGLADLQGHVNRRRKKAVAPTVFRSRQNRPDRGSQRFGSPLG